MAKVIILNHSDFFDRKTQKRFDERIITRTNGTRVHLGVAVMSDEEAEKFYAGRPQFEVQYDEPREDDDAPEASSDDSADAARTEEPKAEAVAADNAKEAASEASETTSEATPEGAEIAPITALDEDADWYTVDELSALTIEKLKAVAKAENVDVSKCSLKDEYINTILAAGAEE